MDLTLHNNVLNYIKNIFRNWIPLSQRPSTFFIDSSYCLPGRATKEQSLSLSAFFNALDLYCSTISHLPIVTYSDNAGLRERATTAPEYKILHDRPNPAMSLADWLTFAVKSLFLDGNFVCQIGWTSNSRLLGLYPIAWSSVKEVRLNSDWTKTLLLHPGVVEGDVLQDWEFLHIHQYSDDGLQGRGLLSFAAETMGLHSQIQAAANAYYRNAARPSGYLKFTGKLSPEALTAVKTGFKEVVTGSNNSGNLAVLENGVDFVPFDLKTSEEMNMIAAMQLSTTSIAQFFRLDPAHIGDLSGRTGTYSNMTQTDATFYKKSLAPVLNLIEQELNYKIFSKTNRFCEFVIEKVIEGDVETQARIYQTALGNQPWLTPDEVRAFYNRGPMPKPEPEPEVTEEEEEDSSEEDSREEPEEGEEDGNTTVVEEQAVS